MTTRSKTAEDLENELDAKIIAMIAANPNKNKYKNTDFIEADEEEACEDKGIYEVNIDFDGASEAWKANKKPSGNSCYNYVCTASVATTGKKCTRIVKSGCEYCAMHNKNKTK